MDLGHQRNGLTTKELQERIDTYHCDLAYEKALNTTADVIRNEEVRQLRVKLLLAETMKKRFREKLDIDLKRTMALENENLRTQYDLKVASRNCEKANSDLRACSRENDALKGEIWTVSSNSSALLAEKLALYREVAALKPEVENLRSQATLHQIVLSEKLALEQQLSSLQQELEASKKSTQAAQAAQQISQLEAERLQNKIDSLETELQEERCQHERMEAISKRASSDWESKKTALELRSNTFRNKLRVTLEQLKACQAGLHGSDTIVPSEPDALAADPGRKGFAKPSLKRNSVQQQDPNSMIGTPGDLPAAKKTKRGVTLPGDKSTFSITPFLKRASGVALESPPSEADHNIGLGQKQKSYDHLADQGEPDEAVINIKDGTRAISKTTRPPAQAVHPKPRAIGSSGTSKTKSSLLRNNRVSPSLENVSEMEEDNQNDPLLTDKPIHQGAEVQKRKRKVLTGRLHKPIVDDAQNRTVRDEQKPNFAALDREKTSITSASNFGNISPLKGKRRPILVNSKNAAT